MTCAACGTGGQNNMVKLELDQGQKFVAVMKAKNQGTATSQNAKKSRHCRGKNRTNRGLISSKIIKIAALSRQIF
jgi:hypothetical protein